MVVEADMHIDVVYAYHNRSSAQVQEAYHEALASGGRKGLVRNNPENRLVDTDADMLEISVRLLRRQPRRRGVRIGARRSAVGTLRRFDRSRSFRSRCVAAELGRGELSGLGPRVALSG